MAIVPPISMPTDVVGMAQITLSAESVVSTARSPFTFSEQSYVHPGQRWLASVTIPPVKREKAEPWITFLMSLRGREGFFKLFDPNAIDPQGSHTVGAIRANGGGQVGSSLVVDGFAPSTVGVFKAGDYFRIGEDSSARLYKIMTDVTSDALGGATLEIWPDLRSTVGDNDRLWYNGHYGLFKLANNVTSWNINDISSYGISFDCVEYMY